MEPILNLANLGIIIAIAPFIGAILAGLCGKQIGRAGAHWVTIIGVAIAFLGSLLVVKSIFYDTNFNASGPLFNGTIYVWGTSGGFQFTIGFLIDQLTAVMLVVVTFVSLLVHIYTVGYMADDPGYQRFFSYMSLFTFFMIMLVLANNFLQLFFGWEGVGLVSYLLIGFWFKKESANQGSLKAFIVNRVGDLGFILGIAAIMDTFGTINYQQVFAAAPDVIHKTMEILPGHHWSTITVICICLFIGAMGKSAQVPLHIWLPESMEGPTPISALIHAATMVTAGVFMVTRMSPLFELSDTALSMILILGATGALFTGLIAVVQHDIKRVVAYSTLSQLGYMMAAVGASAYAAGMFQLITHACFKALLFLASGSVIIAMHHEQDMRKMGGLRKYMPITYVTFLIGALALSAIPPFAGFFSKDSIIDAVGFSTITGATYAYWCVLLGAFVTALYIFRAFFYTFHTEERFDAHVRSHLKESPAVVWIPLVILAVPSVILGAFLIYPILYAPAGGLFGGAVVVNADHPVMNLMSADYHGVWAMMLHSVLTPAFWLSVAGIFTAWYCYVLKPETPRLIVAALKWPYYILINKYGFDDFNDLVFVKGTQKFAGFLYKFGDMKLIDGVMVNGSGRLIGVISALMRRIQTGYLYHYALLMIVGLFGFMIWLLMR